MLLLLSPAKTLEETPPTHPALQVLPCTQPDFLPESMQLVAQLRHYDAAALGALMNISASLATLNVARYQEFALPLGAHSAMPAIFAFKGDVYRPLSAATYDTPTLAFMNQHVRILSGLYGVLRPLDYLYPYRLEMGTALPCGKAQNLYQFWGEKITHAVNEAAKAAQVTAIINLASQEYFKAVKVEKLQRPLIHVEFKEKKGDAYRVVGIHAKAARGMMTEFITRHHLTDPAALVNFTEAGYAFSESLSDATHRVFVR